MSGDKTVSVPAFQIRWAEDDLSALETPPIKRINTSLESESIIIETAPTSTESKSSTESESPSNSPGLPTGAVVGIAIGSAAFVAIMAAVVFFLFWKRIRNASQKNQSPPAQDQPGGGMAELATSQPIYATAATNQPHGGGTVAELEPHEKGSPLFGYTGDGFGYIPTNAHGTGMPPELPHDSRAPVYGSHINPEMGFRHELGVQERAIAEMDGTLPHGGTSRHELS